MSIIHNYCITGRNFNFLNNLNMNIILAGSDDKNLSDYPDNWIKDNNGLNISNKNKNFGTLSSHFWLWKNKLKDYSDEDWIGINHYRRFWVKKENNDIIVSNLSNNILREIPSGENFDALLPEKIVIENLKFSKLFKKGFQNYIRKPSLLFNRKKISIELLYYPTIKPFDFETLRKSVKKTEKILVVEEHCTNGGATGYVQETLIENKISNSFFLTLPNSFIDGYGEYEDLAKKVGFTKENFRNKIKALLKKG